MERLWAPWRKGYVEAGAPRGCIFCEKSDAGDDAKHHIIARGKSCFSLLNRFPYNGGHLMVAPFRHVAALDALTDEELLELMRMIRDQAALLRRRLSPDGFNIGINIGRVAGAGVADHLHVHVVPRWSGDTNFMPATADTKVISHALDEMYSRLTGAAK
ncbi:MAG: HIT domain-containing protein [Candidatus Aureabacteria bacterium]|nr:HIT domain-containing protein [Candidatus Auribacterota bacterium]